MFVIIILPTERLADKAIIFVTRLSLDPIKDRGSVKTLPMIKKCSKPNTEKMWRYHFHILILHEPEWGTNSLNVPRCKLEINLYQTIRIKYIGCKTAPQELANHHFPRIIKLNRKFLQNITFQQLPQPYILNISSQKFTIKFCNHNTPNSTRLFRKNSNRIPIKWSLEWKDFRKEDRKYFSI